MKIIKIQDNNYFFDPSNPGEKKYKYKQGMHLLYNDEEFVPYIDTKNKFAQFNYNGEIYIIEDPYANSLIRAGYVVLDNYDHEFITNPEEGYKVHDDLISILKKSLEGYKVIDDTPSRISFEIEKENFIFTICISSVNEIVRRNQERKINNQQYFPFNKSMDKYGTVYIGIYAYQTDEPPKNSSEKFNIADEILQVIINDNERIKYIGMDLKHPVYYIM